MERIGEFLRAIRIRDYLGDVRTLQTIAAGLLALVVILGLVALSYGVRYYRQEAALQQALQEQTEPAPPPAPEIRGGAFPASPLPELVRLGEPLLGRAFTNLHR